MTFFTILIALALVQLWGSGAPLQRDGWFYDWSQRVAGRLEKGSLRLLAMVLVPVVLLLLVQDLVQGVLFGLLSLLLYIAVLLYALGRGDFKQTLQRYLSAWVDGDSEAAYQHALAMGNFHQSETINDPGSLHRAMRRASLYEGYQRWFAVVFWFFLLGPAAALAYRLVQLTAANEQLKDADRQLALRVLHYLDWFPARLLILAFFLTGNFVGGTNKGPSLFDNMPINELLDRGACAAISTEQAASAPADPTQQIEQARIELRDIESLLSRSVVCWVCLIAVLALIGF